MKEKEERLRQEIMKDASRKAERTLQRARGDADKAADKIRRRLEKVHTAALEEATKKAEEQYRAVTAGVEQEKLQRWLRRREGVIEELFSDVLGELCDGAESDRSESLQCLLREALKATGPGSFAVRVSPADKPTLTWEYLEAVAKEAFEATESQGEFDVQTDSRIRGGVVLDSTDGTRHLDNTYAMRLQRMKQDLRTALCAACLAEKNADGGTTGVGTTADKEQQDA